MLTFKFRDAVVEAMKTFFRTVLFGTLMAGFNGSFCFSEK